MQFGITLFKGCDEIYCLQFVHWNKPSPTHMPLISTIAPNDIRRSGSYESNKLNSKKIQSAIIINQDFLSDMKKHRKDMVKSVLLNNTIPLSKIKNHLSTSNSQFLFRLLYSQNNIAKTVEEFETFKEELGQNNRKLNSENISFKNLSLQNNIQ